jgi:3,4-dihydroxy 2-butanone 4-phosphate synthase/GTP cyclohydrolase II
LEGYGLRVTGRQSLPVHANPENIRYLLTKRDRMGHELDIEGEAAE